MFSGVGSPGPPHSSRGPSDSGPLCLPTTSSLSRPHRDEKYRQIDTQVLYVFQPPKSPRLPRLDQDVKVDAAFGPLFTQSRTPLCAEVERKCRGVSPGSAWEVSVTGESRESSLVDGVETCRDRVSVEVELDNVSRGGDGDGRVRDGCQQDQETRVAGGSGRVHPRAVRERPDLLQVRGYLPGVGTFLC